MTIDLGRVTPIYRGSYAAATTYELNDIVLYNGDLYWHTGQTPTTGTAPTNTEPWALAFAGSDVKALIESYASAASNSASSASASAGNAATSATAAGGSATAAAELASAAAGSAKSAAASASSAASSAEDAAGSAAQAAGIVYTVGEDGTRYAVTKAVVNGYLVETFTEVT